MSDAPPSNIEDLLLKEHAKDAEALKRRAKSNVNGKARTIKGLVLREGFMIANTDYPPPVFVVDKLVPQGLTIAAGRPKVGKSWLALQMAIAVALGEPVLKTFRVAMPGKVLYLALEEPEWRTHHRLKQIVPNPDARLNNLRFVYQIDPLMTGGAVQLDQELQREPSDLVVVDTILALTAAHSGRKDILRGDYQEINVLREMCIKHKAAMVCVAHSRKGSGDLVDSIIGTTGVTAAADSLWLLKRAGPQGEAVLELTGREVEGTTYGLKFNTGDPFGWLITGEGFEAEMSQERRDILMLLSQEGAQKPAVIARMLGNKNTVTVRRLLQKMVLDGVVSRQANGTYVPTPQSQYEVQ